MKAICIRLIMESDDEIIYNKCIYGVYWINDPSCKSGAAMSFNSQLLKQDATDVQNQLATA